jgi:O-antigen ligase
MSIKKMVSESIEYYVLYYVFVRVVTNRGTINRILFAIVAAVIVCSALGAVEAYNNWAVIDWFPRVTHHFDGWSVQVEFSGRGQRVATTFAHPILFGAGLVMAIVLTLYLLKVTSGIGKKALLWGGLLLMFLNIYKTSSRGPWLGLILSFAALFIWEKGRGRRYLTMIGILSMTVLLIRPGIWETLGNMYVGTLDPNSPLGSSYEYRYALRDLAVKTVSKSAERALWGYGMESFYYLGLEADLNGKPYKFLSCDSAWVELMVETGYVGLLIVGAILLVPPWFAWNSLRRSPHSGDRVQLYLMTIMLAYYFMMLSAAMYGWGQTGYILWMIIAASTVHNRLQIARAPGTKAKPMEIEDEAPLARLAPSLNCGG